GDGIATASFLAFLSVALQTDGKIVVAGAPTISSIDFALVRFNPNGTLDSSFGGDGIVNVPESHSTNRAYSVMIGPSNKITAIGSSNLDAFAAARFNSDGSLDPSFGDEGSVLTPLGGSWIEPTTGVLQSDGKLITAGYFDPVSVGSDFALTRLNVDGSLDTAFDKDGILASDIGDATMLANGVAVQDDGRIVT